MTATIQLPWGRTATVSMAVEDEPLFPTPGERGEMREPTVEEFRIVLCKLAKLDFQSLDTDQPATVADRRYR